MGNNWPVVRFTRAVEINPPVHLKRGVIYPFLDMASVDPGRRFAVASEARKFSGGGSRFIAGDTLMARITPCLENGKLCCYYGKGPAAGSTEFIVVRGRQGETTNEFAYYLTRSPIVRDFAISKMTGSSGRQRVPTDVFDHLEIPLPPLPIQKRIAHILGTLDDKIELNRKINETLEAVARALFQSWFIDFDPVHAKAAGRDPGLPKPIADLFPSEFETSELGLIPKGWRVGKIEDIAEINAWALRKTDDLEAIDYIEISEVARGDVGTIARYPRGEEPSRARRRLKHGDTVISTVRPDRGAFFLAVNPSDSLIASTGFAVLTSKNGNWAFLHAATTRSEFGQELGHLADGGAYPAVRPEVIASRPVVIPGDPQVVIMFEVAAQPLFLRADTNRRQNVRLTALRDTLLPKLFSGELSIPAAEKTPSEVT